MARLAACTKFAEFSTVFHCTLHGLFCEKHKPGDSTIFSIIENALKSKDVIDNEFDYLHT